VILDPCIEEPAFREGAPELFMDLWLDPDIGVGIARADESNVEFTILGQIHDTPDCGGRHGVLRHPRDINAQLDS
jgi:hypothetical protein